MSWILHAALTVVAVAVAVLVSSKLFVDVEVKRPKTSVTVALVFGVLNVLVGWLLRTFVALALLPAAVFTLGLAYLFFGVIVNSVLLWLTDKLVGDFEIRSFRGLFGTAALISFATWVLQLVAK
jgi:putative membrane protein